jgi:hypothetical protein
MRIFRSKPRQIVFQPFNEYVEASQSWPVSASKCMPDWYKKLPRYVNNSDKPIKSLGRKDLKTCVPFRDAMISGYMIVLPADIEVTISHDGDVDIFCNPNLTFDVIHKRGWLTESNQGFGMPNPIGTVPIMFAFSAFYGIKTNKTESVLITHPLNRNDLPFVTTSGIIDSGYAEVAGNIPFFIKEGFSGVIPKGTPIAQVIPFKRENWKSSLVPNDKKFYSLFMTLRDSYLEGYYGKFLRQPRSYK